MFSVQGYFAPAWRRVLCRAHVPALRAVAWVVSRSPPGGHALLFQSPSSAVAATVTVTAAVTVLVTAAVTATVMGQIYRHTDPSPPRQGGNLFYIRRRAPGSALTRVRSALR